MKTRIVSRMWTRWTWILAAGLISVLAASLSRTESRVPDSSQGNGEPASERGRWLTESGNLEVNIASCGKALCGTVVKVLGNRSMSNPNATMQAADSRPALGMQILSDFVASGDGEWSGRIYNRENAKSYDCNMQLIAPDQLKIRAYKFLPIFGKTQIWKRVPAGAQVER